jgi:photosystem II stability/assembly factor-like uncharacterized protein
VRRRRAVAFITLAVLVIAAASLYYLRPRLAPQSSAAAATGTRATVQPSDDLVSYEFWSAALGWAVEAPSTHATSPVTFRVFTTLDGGKHWAVVLIGETAFAQVTISSLHFTDAFHGAIAAGDPLAIYRTSDAGAHWTRAGSPGRDTVQVRFTDSIHGWAWTTPPDPLEPPVHLFSTADGGATWNHASSTPPGASRFPVFRNPSEGWAGASDPSAAYVYLTTNGGMAWSRRRLPQPPDTSDAVSTEIRLLPGRGVVATVSSESLVTHHYTSFDGGDTWNPVTLPIAGASDSFFFEDTRRWWLVEGIVLYKTSNAGESWTEFARVPSGLDLIQVLNSKYAWASLDEGHGAELASSADGGAHWTAVNVPMPA